MVITQHELRTLILEAVKELVEDIKKKTTKVGAEKEMGRDYRKHPLFIKDKGKFLLHDEEEPVVGSDNVSVLEQQD